MKYRRDRQPLPQNRTMRRSSTPYSPYTLLNLQNPNWYTDWQQIPPPEGWGLPPWGFNGAQNNNGTATVRGSVTSSRLQPTPSSSNLSLISRIPNHNRPENSQVGQISQVSSLDEPVIKMNQSSEIARVIWRDKSPTPNPVSSTHSDLQSTRSFSSYQTPSDMKRREPIPGSTPLHSSGVLRMVKTPIPDATPKDCLSVKFLIHDPIPVKTKFLQDPRLLHSKFLQARTNKAITPMTQEKPASPQASLPPPSENRNIISIKPIFYI